MSMIIGKFKNTGAVDPLSDRDLSLGQRDMAYADLKGMAEAYRALASLCTEEESIPEVKELLRRELDHRVCCECPRHVCCFGRSELPVDIFEAYYKVLEQYGAIYSDDISEELRMICPQSRRLAATANTAYELIQSRQGEMRAQKRTKALLFSEFSVMSKALMITANRIRSTSRNKMVEDKLLQKLKGVFKDFTVMCYEDDQGFQTVELSMRGSGFSKDDAKIAERICSLCCNIPMEAQYDGYGFETGGLNSLRLVPKPRFTMEVGTAMRSKEDVCGDSWVLTTNRFGHAVFGIADGMGTGCQAAEVSRTVATMCEKAFALGLPIEDVVATANGAAYILPNRDKYTTLDLMDLNMHTGRAEYHKLCGCPSLLVRKGKMESLSSTGQPLGMMEHKEEIGITHLQHGDTIMMCSDGIWNNLPEDKEEALGDILTMPDINQAADIVAGMCQLASGNSQGAADDMTVMIVRIWEI